MELNPNLPIPAIHSEALPDCPPPEDNLEALVRIDGKDARIGFAASYHAAGIACAPRTCLVRAGVFPLLQRAAGLLPDGYSLLIFDAYRPLAVQQALYENAAAGVRRLHPACTPEEVAAAVGNFVALPGRDPKRPAPHATGGAVDLTLCLHGTPVEMGTAFDDFSPNARTAAWEEKPPTPQNKAIRGHRRLLYHTMLAAGFVNYSEEWWHYSYGDRLWARTLGKTPFYGLAGEDAVCD